MKNCSFFDHHFHLFTFQIDHLFSVKKDKRLQSFLKAFVIKIVNAKFFFIDNKCCCRKKIMCEKGEFLTYNSFVPSSYKAQLNMHQGGKHKIKKRQFFTVNI